MVKRNGLLKRVYYCFFRPFTCPNETKNVFYSLNTLLNVCDDSLLKYNIDNYF